MKHIFLRIATTILLVCAVTITALIVRREFFLSYNMPQPDLTPIRQIDMDTWQQVLKGGLVIGPSTAKVKIVEFYDYECSFCRRIQPNLNEIRQKYPADVSIILRHYPLSFHATAYSSAIAAECAYSQGLFEVYHGALFEHQNLVATLDWIGLARNVGIPDLPRFRECVEQNIPSVKIDDDIRLGESLEIIAIPTLIINRMLFQGVLAVSDLDKLVQQVIQNSEIPSIDE